MPRYFNYLPCTTRYVECPYNDDHLLRVEIAEAHIAICRSFYVMEMQRRNGEVTRIPCKHNNAHDVVWVEYKIHLDICPDRVAKGLTDKPGYSLGFWETYRRDLPAHTIYVNVDDHDKKRKQNGPRMYQGKDLMFPLEL